MAHEQQRTLAPSPWRFGWRDWRAVLARTWRQTLADDIDLMSAGVAFYGFLALVPMLGAIVLCYGLLATPDSVVALFRKLTAVMPADAAGLIRQQLLSIVATSDGKKGTGLALAIVLALYGARSGMGAVITALNMAYEERETRGLIHFNLIALGVTVTAILIALLGIGAATALAALQHWLPPASPALIVAERAGSWLALALAGGGSAAALYWIGPNRQMRGWRWLTPGAVLTSVGWMLATLGFGAFVANFGHYNATYGSLAAVIVLLTWFYLSSLILLVGAELNSECERQADLLNPDAQPAGTKLADAAPK